MCDQTEIEYKAGEIVWCKLSKLWWPAQVQDQESLDQEVTQGLRKKPLAVVKFFDEDYYDFVKDIKQICHYNSSRKFEFIKKGMDAYRSMGETNQMSKFPKDILTAEELTSGNLNILEDPRLAPDEKVNYKEVFNTPKPQKDVKSFKKLKNPSNRNKICYSQVISKSGPKKQYFTKYLIQACTKPSDIQFKCPDCNFVCTRLRLLSYHRSYNKFTGCPKVPTRYGKSNSLPFKVDKTVIKRKPVGHDVSPAKKKIKSPAIKNDDSLKKVKNAVPKEVKEKDKKKSEAMREQLLLDWNEEEVAEEEVAEESCEVVDVKADDKPTIQNVSNTSCFDFEDNEEDMNMDRSMRFGQKLPRVIPKEDKNKEGKLKDKSADQEDLLEEEFNNIMKETSVPVVPIMTDSFLSDSSALPDSSGKAEANLGNKEKEILCVDEGVKATEPKVDTKDVVKKDILSVADANLKISDKKRKQVQPRLKPVVEIVDDNRSLLHDLESDSPAENDSDSSRVGDNHHLSQDILEDLQTDSELLHFLHNMKKVNKEEKVNELQEEESLEKISEGVNKVEEKLLDSRQTRSTSMPKELDPSMQGSSAVVKETSPLIKDDEIKANPIKDVKDTTKHKGKSHFDDSSKFRKEIVSKRDVPSCKSPQKSPDNFVMQGDSPNFASSKKRKSTPSKDKIKFSDNTELDQKPLSHTSDINSDGFHSSTDESFEIKIKMLISDCSGSESQEDSPAIKQQKLSHDDPKDLTVSENSDTSKLKKPSSPSNAVLSRKKQSKEKQKSNQYRERISAEVEARRKSGKVSSEKDLLMKNGMNTKKEQSFNSPVDRKNEHLKRETILKVDLDSSESKRKFDKKTLKEKHVKSSHKERSKLSDIDKFRMLKSPSREKTSLTKSDSLIRLSTDISYKKSDVELSPRKSSGSSPSKRKSYNDTQSKFQEKGESKRFRSQDKTDSRSHKQDLKGKSDYDKLKKNLSKEKLDEKHEVSKEKSAQRCPSQSKSSEPRTPSNQEIKQISPRGSKSNEKPPSKKKKLYDDAYNDLFKPDVITTKIPSSATPTKPKLDPVKADQKDKSPKKYDHKQDKLHSESSKRIMDSSKRSDVRLSSSPKTLVSNNSHSLEHHPNSSKSDDNKSHPERKKSNDSHKLGHDKKDGRESRQSPKKKTECKKDDILLSGKPENLGVKLIDTEVKTSCNISSIDEKKATNECVSVNNSVSPNMENNSFIQNEGTEKIVCDNLEVDSQIKHGPNSLLQSVVNSENVNLTINEIVDPLPPVNDSRESPKKVEVDSNPLSEVKEHSSQAVEVSSYLSMTSGAASENKVFVSNEEKDTIESKLHNIHKDNACDALVLSSDITNSSLNVVNDEIVSATSLITTSPLQIQDSVDRELEEMFSSNNQCPVSMDTTCKDKTFPANNNMKVDSSSSMVIQSDRVVGEVDASVSLLENKQSSVKEQTTQVMPTTSFVSDNIPNLDCNKNCQNNAQFLGENSNSLDCRGNSADGVSTVSKSVETTLPCDNSTCLKYDTSMEAKQDFGNAEISLNSQTLDSVSSSVFVEPVSKAVIESFQDACTIDDKSILSNSEEGVNIAPIKQSSNLIEGDICNPALSELKESSASCKVDVNIVGPITDARSMFTDANLKSETEQLHNLNELAAESNVSKPIGSEVVKTAHIKKTDVGKEDKIVLDMPQDSTVGSHTVGETVVQSDINSIPAPPVSEVVIDMETANFDHEINSCTPGVFINSASDDKVGENDETNLFNFEESTSLPPISDSKETGSFDDFQTSPLSSDFLTPDKIKEIFKQGKSSSSTSEPSTSVIRPIVVPPQAILEGNMSNQAVAGDSALLDPSGSRQDMQSTVLDINSMPIVIDDSPVTYLPENLPSTSNQPASPEDALPPYTIKILSPSDNQLANFYVKLAPSGTFKGKLKPGQTLINIPPAKSRTKASDHQPPPPKCLQLTTLEDAVSPYLLKTDDIMLSADGKQKIIFKAESKKIYSDIDGKLILTGNSKLKVLKTARILQPAIGYAPSQNKHVPTICRKKMKCPPLTEHTKTITISSSAVGNKISFIKTSLESPLQGQHSVKKTILIKRGDTIKSARPIKPSPRGHNALEPSTSGGSSMCNTGSTVLKHDKLSQVLANRDVFHETNPPGDPTPPSSKREQSSVSSSKNVSLVSIDGAKVTSIQLPMSNPSDESALYRPSSSRVPSSSQSNTADLELIDLPLPNTASMDISGPMVAQLTADINLAEIELPAERPRANSPPSNTFTDVSSIPLPPDPFTSSVSSTNLLPNPSDKFSKS